MTRPPLYPHVIAPRAPHWRRWWLALLMLCSVQAAALLALWPKGQPQLELWLWSAVLPLSWAMVLALRVLVWQIAQFQTDVYRGIRDEDLQRWWRRRGLGLPVQQVLLLGPAGDEQAQYCGLMSATPVPKLSLIPGATQPALRCRLSLSNVTERGPALARHLARLTLALPELSARWPALCGVAWAGDAGSETAFTQQLAKAGVRLPETRVPLGDLADLDALIEGFYPLCQEAADWLLCAGVVSLECAGDGDLPGEAGFLWVVDRQARQLLHRGEYLLSESNESPAELCAQVQCYAGLDGPPPSCLALDKISQVAFAQGGWCAAEHQLSTQWGLLGNLAPFIGMSLALLQAKVAAQPCGWLSQDAEERLAIGVVVPHGNH